MSGEGTDGNMSLNAMESLGGTRGKKCREIMQKKPARGGTIFGKVRGVLETKGEETTIENTKRNKDRVRRRSNRRDFTEQIH